LPTPSPTPPLGLLFSDEFTGITLSSAWTALNQPGDSSNAEEECYLPSNAVVANGLLTLTSRVDRSCAGYAYTSSMV
jgi:hypothetical protein